MEQNVSDLREDIKKCNICATGAPERKEKLVQKIDLKKKLLKFDEIQIQENQQPQIYNKCKDNHAQTNHKLQKILKAARGKTTQRNKD